MIPFDNFTDVLGLFENYLICIFINIDIKKSLENHRKIAFILGMSFGVKFKVRTFGNKHPDGSNVRNFSDHAIYYMYIYISVNRVLP